MSSSFDDAVSRLASQADAVGRLAQDDGGFAAVVAAFESRDTSAFRWVLDRLNMLPYCELICEWVRIKLCVLRCSEICIPIRENPPVPNFEVFARAVARLAENEEGLRRVVDAVGCGNAEDYAAALEAIGLREFCYPLCRWICSVGYRRVCEIVCRAEPVAPIDPAQEVLATARAVAGLVKNEAVLSAVAKAAAVGNCEILRETIGEFDGDNALNRCEIICRLVCSWRCLWVCRVLCEEVPPVLAGVYGIEEARSFALAFRKLASQPRALSDLVVATQEGNAKAYQSIIGRYALEPYCHQICAWICSIVCHEFCRCVCPPALTAYFTSIGGYLYETQVDSALPATGLTISSAPNAFYSYLRLNGVLTQTTGGQPLEYSFWYQPITMASTTLKNPIGAGDTSITVNSSSGFPATPFNVVIGNSGGGYEIMTVTNVSGTAWTVVRGQQGTTAAAAIAGATIASGVSAGGSWTQIPQSWIAETIIGEQETFIPTPPFIEVKNVTVNGGPGDLNVSFTPDGWIQVPQGSDIFLNGNMILLDSTQLPGFSTGFDETGVVAGNAANPAAPTDLYFGLQMQVRPSGATTGTPAGTCSVVAINNYSYNNVSHHPEWGGSVVNGARGVATVDIAELQSAGCAGITDSLTVLFTASHANLGGVSITMEGPAGTTDLTLPPPIPQTGDWHGTAINGFVVSDLESCAYLITLSADLLLTDGDGHSPSPLQDQIAFCKS